jgi:hypothetical protein
MNGFKPKGSALRLGETPSIVNDANKSVVLDRELDEEKSKGPSDPRIRCPVAPSRRQMVLHLRL